MEGVSGPVTEVVEPYKMISSILGRMYTYTVVHIDSGQPLLPK